MEWSLELAEELVSKIAGPESLRLLRLMYNKENLSEFDLAEHLKVNINQARHSLYELQKHNLISSTRKKDKEKGWYVYYWTFNNKNARDLLLELKSRRLKMLEKQVDREKSGDYMVCPEGCVTVPVDDAMDTDFRCPTCEEMLEYRRDEGLIKKKEREISKLKAELKEGIEMPVKKRKRRRFKPAKRKPARRRRKSAKRKPRKRKPARKRATPKRRTARKKPQRKSTRRRNTRKK